MDVRVGLLLESVEMLHAMDSGQAFRERVLRACQHLFPDSCASLELWDRISGELTAVYAVPFDEKNLEERLRRIGEAVRREHPAYPIVAGGHLEPMRLSDLTTMRQFQKTELYDLSFKPARIEKQVILPIQSDIQLGGATFNRDGSKDFTAEDILLMKYFCRQLVVAHQNELVLKQSLQTRPKVETWDHLELRRAGLTRRESEVFAWMAQGKRDREIATILGISYRTVTNHVYSILRKLGVETRTAALGAMKDYLPQA